MTDGAIGRNVERADTLGNGNDLGNDFVGLDDADLRTFTSNAQTFAFADITQRGALYRCTL